MTAHRLFIHRSFIDRLGRLVRLGALALAAVAPLAHAQVSLDDPRSGWRSASPQQQDFLQEVHYPAASVNVNAKSASALIRGRIAKMRKADSAGGARQPARLVVDGIAMPLLVDEDGNFARPWSFGTGSHGIEVRSPDGQVKRRQFYEAQPDRVRTRLRVVLSWDSDSTDLDLHVVSPDGQHVFYGARVAANGGALDVDVTTGFGPEIFATPAPLRGAYHVFVNYYGAGEQRGVITTAQVAIIQDEGTPQEKQQVFRVPLRKPGELTLVRAFQMP
ncbi:DUF2135 domain-containing protein [Roseateles sp.]|uniref:YfaP family protein n=1 Tax=Roseateles sp. TaxID=1971397 RepID=UPI00326373A7